jgi:hypothetical protein
MVAKSVEELLSIVEGAVHVEDGFTVTDRQALRGKGEKS